MIFRIPDDEEIGIVLNEIRQLLYEELIIDGSTYIDTDVLVDFLDEYLDGENKIDHFPLPVEEFTDWFIETAIIPLREFLYKQNYYDYLKENGYYDNCDF